MDLRVIENNGKFYVQRKKGIIFRKWEYLDEYGFTLDEYHDDDPIVFENMAEAIIFMEDVFETRPTLSRQEPLKIVAWIGSRN